MFSKFVYASGIALLSIALVEVEGLLWCKCKYIVHIIELSYVSKIGKMKVDNLVVLTLFYSLIWTFLPHAMCKFVFSLY